MALIGMSGEGGQKWPPSAPPQGGPVKKYKTVINGLETTLLLNDADAKAQGLLPESEPQKKAPAKAPANKAARPPANKAASSGADKRAEAVERSFGGSKKPAEGDA